MANYFLRVAARVAVRNKGLYKDLRKKYPKVPEYVLKQVYNGVSEDKVSQMGSFESILKDYNSRDWKLETVDLSWGKLNRITRNNILRRKFGIENPDKVPDDADRLERQIESLAGTGENEPVVFLETEGGLELVEGYHRTMALLLKGAGDVKETLQKLAEAEDREMEEMARNWKSVKAKAWVGRGGSDDEIEMPEGDFF